MADRLRAFLAETYGRLLSFLQGIDSLNALVAVIAVLGLSLLVLSAAVIYSAVSSREEAAEQAIRGEGITVAPQSRAEDFPLVFGPGPSNRLAELTSTGRLRGIPGLSDMDVISNLKYFPGATIFRCSGPSPDRGLTKQVCKACSNDSNASYEVTVVEQNPATVLSVEATVYEASEEEATAFWPT